MHSESHVCFCSIIPSSILNSSFDERRCRISGSGCANDPHHIESARFPRTIEHRRTVARGCYTYGSATPGVQM